jgi:hypothetical protein
MADEHICQEEMTVMPFNMGPEITHGNRYFKNHTSFIDFFVGGCKTTKWQLNESVVTNVSSRHKGYGMEIRGKHTYNLCCTYSL